MATSLHTLNTFLRLSLGGVEEHEVNTRVSFWFTPAWPESRDDPGSGAFVEIDSIQLFEKGEYHALPRWVVDAVREDEELIAQCLMEIQDDGDRAAEYRADQMRDDRMMERF